MDTKEAKKEYNLEQEGNFGSLYILVGDHMVYYDDEDIDIAHPSRVHNVLTAQWISDNVKIAELVELVKSRDPKNDDAPILTQESSWTHQDEKDSERLTITVTNRFHDTETIIRAKKVGNEITISRRQFRKIHGTCEDNNCACMGYTRWMDDCGVDYDCIPIDRYFGYSYPHTTGVPKEYELVPS
jgi:hypothetical protein